VWTLTSRGRGGCWEERARLHNAYAPGDLLWVRENVTRFDRGSCDQHVWYHAGGNGEPFDHCCTAAHALGCSDGAWPKDREGPGGGLPYSVPSIHMPRWASRLTLEVTGVKVERLQDISEADAVAEGIFQFHGISCFGYDKKGTPGRHARDTARKTYACLWDEINGAGAWEQNPWVVAVMFRITQANVDALLAQQVVA
jgi:hypothetical protein